MKAIVHDRYGAFELLTLRDIDKPVINDEQVLVRVHAAGLHVGDCFGVRGSPLPMRVVSGIFKPKIGIPGFDLAGRVEAVGAKVTRFQPGDEVFGASMGTCAEYAQAKENELALKPADLGFEQAAALPTSALADCRRALTPDGTLLLNSGTGAQGIRMMVRLLKPLLLSPFLRQNLRRYLSVPNHADLGVLKELVEAGKLDPVIGQTYELGETADALRHIDGGHARGKVVVSIGAA